MIQRVQTIYLLLAIVAIGLVFFMDLCYFGPAGGDLRFGMDLYSVRDLDGGGAVTSSAYWLWSSILLTFLEVVLIAAVFTYKQRMKQLKLVHLSYLLEAGAIVLLTFSIDHSLVKLDEASQELVATYWIGWYMPVVAIAFSFLAARGIKKDEELVRSVDRLR